MQSVQRKNAYAGTLVMAEDPMVAVMEQVLTEEEMAHVINVAGSRIRRARVSLDDSYTITEGRSGSNCWLSYDSDEVIAGIGRRIATIVGIPLSHAEAMQVIHYGPGQEYRAHYDAYDLATTRGQRCCAYGGQRLVTALVYLNAIAEGGATTFPQLNVTVASVPGRMVIFHNTGDDADMPHPRSLHAGTPVTRGEKWAFNIWFHARPMRERQTYAAVPSSGRVEDAGLAPPPAVAATGTVNDRFSTRINRASAIFAAAFQALEADIAALTEPVCFTYWDTYGNNLLPAEDLVAGQRIIRLLERRISNPLAQKGSLARLLRERGLTHLAPPTYDAIGDALAAHPDDTAVWYFKSVYGTGGKGMFCIAHSDLEQQVLPQDFILQAGVRDIELDAGRKFTTRIYLLVWAGELYFYHNGFTVTHGRDYEPDSTDYAVQIDHRGYERADGAVRIAPGLGNPTFRRFLPALGQLARELAPALADCLHASDRDSYLVLGIDTLLCRDGTVKLIEINTAPNFIHSPEVNAEVNVPFFEAVIRTLLGDSDPRLKKIGT